MDERKLVAVLGCCFLSLCLSAQSEAIAVFDSGFVETGNPFMLHLAVPVQYGQPAAIDFAPWDSLIPAENRLRQTGWKKQTGQWTSDLTLILFDSMDLLLPPLPLISAGGDTLRTNALELQVIQTPSPDDPADMLDIKDIRHEPANWRDYLKPALPVVGGVLLFALIVWWLLLRRRKKSGLKAIRTVRQPAHELALRKLAELERQQYWQRSQLKTYYSELTHIVREYLERRYHIPALESASDEILRLLLRTDMPSTLMAPLSELLRWADLAKFAKGQPPEHFHEQALREARQLIEQTRMRASAVNGQTGGSMEAKPADSSSDPSSKNIDL